MADLTLYYWDACIFYEFLKGEQPNAAKRAAIESILAENKQKKNRIFTSSITHVEVFPKKLTPDEERAYWSCFSSMYFFDVELDRSIISLAREIRDYYYRPKTEDASYKIMGTGDAIHIATAIIHGASQLLTRDKKTKGGNVPLVGLPESSPNGKICGKYEVNIVNPETLDLFTRSAE